MDVLENKIDQDTMEMPVENEKLVMSRSEKRAKAKEEKEKKKGKQQKDKKINKNDSKSGSKKKGKKINKKESTFKGEGGFTYPFGYRETDPYLFIGEDTVVSIYDVLFQYGTNNPARIGWMLDLLPKRQLKSGQVKFVERQKNMSKSEEDEIVEKRLRSNVATLSSTKTSNSKEDTKNTMRVRDMRISEVLAGEEDTIVDSDMQLIIKAATPELVEETLEELKMTYKDYEVKGVIFSRSIGNLFQKYKKLLTEPVADSWHNADMSSIAATRMFLPSSGFSDTTGEFVGYDVRSLLAMNPAIIDFQGIRSGIIFTGGVNPSVSHHTDFRDTYFAINGGSAIAHVIADGNYLSGQRTHHIVLSNFKYHSPDNLVFDMSKEVINLLEVFGTPDTVQQDATANFQKAVTIMTLLTKVSDQEKNYLYTELMTLLVDWFIKRANGNGMYSDNPESNPIRAQRILAKKDHTKYPKPTDFLPALQTNVAERSKEGEQAQKDARFIYDSMKTTFVTYPNIFGKTTTIPDVFKSDIRNVYYDLSEISEDKTVTGAVFLNVLAYVTNRALDGEMIVIHGLDQIDVPLEPLLPYRERMDRKNIGLLTVFEKSENKINPSTFKSFVGRMSQQDMVVLGGINESELTYINESWQKNLPIPVTNQLLTANESIFYFYRKRDRTGAIIDTRLVL